VEDSFKSVKTTSESDTYNCNYLNGIIESDTNENGRYIKLIDGTLICYNIVPATYANTNTWYEVITDFAYDFISYPNVTLTVRESGNRTINVTYYHYFTNRIGIKYNSQNNAGGTSNISYIAIGRWK